MTRPSAGCCEIAHSRYQQQGFDIEIMIADINVRTWGITVLGITAPTMFNVDALKRPLPRRVAATLINAKHSNCLLCSYIYHE